MRAYTRVLIVACCLCLQGTIAAAAESYSTAGLRPWQRPEGAPRLTNDPPIDKQQALRGISQPVPTSLKFLDDQGGWFTPFTRPGMTGPYDLRGWHAKPASP